MSKKITRFLALMGLLSLISASILSQGRGTATRPQRSETAIGPSRNAAIVATTAAVLKETSELRELSILRAVKSGAQSRTEIEHMIVKNLDEENTPAESHAAEGILKAYGLVPKDFDYRAFLIKLLTEQVAGYYDPKVQQFYLADWIELEAQKPVMAHELTHALQDQHFNLRRFEKWPRGDSDAELAAHALIEGDATLAMTLYTAKNPLVALAFIRSLGTNGASLEQYNQAPRAIKESLLFPYEEGSAWATQVYKRGGWELVSRAFDKLPQSTEQILHPDKYFSYEGPVKVTLPDFKASLGPGWKRIAYDVMGEWGYYLALDEYLKDGTGSKRAAAGWAGDRFAVYEGSNPGDLFVPQMTVWDTANDAREFFDAYSQRIAKRFAGAKEVGGNSEDRHTWETTAGRAFIEIKGTRVLIVEGIPAKMDLDNVIRTSWTSQA
ncbi:MAG TPA: hypothetical protein VFD63_21595 [Pyrinomonadaceae bacterium]|nr:hypothetical protein [Pyrinomonadaceae bacterium]